MRYKNLVGNKVMENRAENRLSSCEDNITHITKHVRDITNLVHQVEINIAELKGMQKQNTDDIKQLRHDIKSLDTAWDTNCQKIYEEIAILYQKIQALKERFIVQDAEQAAKKHLFSNWERVFLFFFASFGMLIGVIDFFLRR